MQKLINKIILPKDIDNIVFALYTLTNKSFKLLKL